jgi:hypothetical protein
MGFLAALLAFHGRERASLAIMLVAMIDRKVGQPPLSSAHPGLVSRADEVVAVQSPGIDLDF